MRRTTALVAALLLLAGCGGSGGDAGSDSAPATGSGVAQSEPTVVPTTTPAEVEAKVVFDGDSCSYAGPEAVLDGTKVAFEFEATAKPDDIAMIVGGVEPGTTWEQFVDWAANNPAGGPPPFAAGGYRVVYGPGSLVMTLFGADYMVACATSPSDTKENFAAGLIEVSET